MNNPKDNLKENTLEVLKFKYGEYLIGNFKDYKYLIEYLEKVFKITDISNDRNKILSLDRFGFIRQSFYNSNLNRQKKIHRNKLTIYYYIIEKTDFNEEYFIYDDLDLIYVAICKELNLFNSNSTLIEHELSIFQGISKEDIQNNTFRLKTYLNDIHNIDLTKTIKNINPDFITPEEQKNILEEYIMDRLNNLNY